MAIACIDNSFKNFCCKGKWRPETTSSKEIKESCGEGIYKKNDPEKVEIYDAAVRGDNCRSKAPVKLKCLGSRMHVEGHRDISSVVTSGKAHEWA